MYGKKQESRLIQTFPLIYKLTLQGQYPFFPPPEFPEDATLGVSAEAPGFKDTASFDYWNAWWHSLSTTPTLWYSRKGKPTETEYLSVWIYVSHDYTHTHTYTHMVYSEFTIWHKIKSRNGIWCFTMKVILCTEGMALKFSCAKLSPGGDC